MTWNEFRTEYKSFLKEYPDASSLWGRGKAIEVITINEVKQGRKWVETDREQELVDLIYYANCVSPETIRFFRNLGGLERVVKSYTKRGLLATEVTSTNPTRDERTIRCFVMQ